MNSIARVLTLGALSLAAASCGFWNPDPADKLGSLVAREARKLEASEGATIAFDFVPDAGRALRSPRSTGEVVIRVAARPAGHPGFGDSTILVCEWFWTTYHNRFVRTPGPLKATKKPGEPFRVVLRKSGDGIDWTELR